MNLPVKIKNKKPWISISDYSNLFVDHVDLSNISTCSSYAPENFFGKEHVSNIIEAVSVVDSNVSFYEDTLEVFFYNLERAIDTLLDYLYLTNPVNVEDETAIDVLLENAINKMSRTNPSVWEDSLVIEDLHTLLLSSYLDYEISADSRTKTGQCRVLFRYLPTGTERVVILDLGLDEQIFADADLGEAKYKIGELPEELSSHIKEELTRSWRESYNVEDSNYQRELYQSIMTNKGGITVDDYYVKSYNYLKYSNKLDTRTIDSYPGYSTIDQSLFNLHSANIISCIAGDYYNEGTINPGFSGGIQGWDLISDSSNLLGTKLTLSSNEDLRVENTNSTSSADDAELIMSENQVSLSQILRAEEGFYELTISLNTNVDRDFVIYIGDISQEFTLTASSTFNTVTLTDTSSGGVEISSDNNGVIKYGILAKQITGTTSLPVETKVEYCQLIKK